MKKIVLVNSGIGLSSIYSFVRKSRMKFWMPLISDFDRVELISKSLVGRSEKLDISKSIQSAAKSLRRPFLKNIAELGKKYDSLEWWAHGISEKNTMTNKLFLKCCYVYLADKCMSEGGSICMICDSNMVMDNIYDIARKRGYEVRIKKSRKPFVLGETILWTIMAAVYDIIKFILSWGVIRLNSIFVKGKSSKGENGAMDVILHTWGDAGSFTTEGEFRDKYFTVLPEYYRKKGLNVRSIVTLFPVSVFSSFSKFIKTVSLFHSKRPDFMLQEDYLKLSDLFFPLALWMKRLRFSFEQIEMEGVDCSILFNAQNRLERPPFQAVFYPLFKRMAGRGIRPALVMDAFENMVSDKMIQFGVRKYMPGTAVYGFFHAVPSPNVLCFFIDETEKDIAPLPDRIICNGPIFKDILIREGFPEEKIVVGPALRYLYLHEYAHTPDEVRSHFTILLVLPLQQEIAMEVFYKLQRAMFDKDTYKLYIKTHPMDKTIVQRIKEDFPSNTKLAGDSSIEENMKFCHVVVGGATSAMMDCIMCGKNVIRVGNSTQFDMDPVAWFPGLGSALYSPREVRAELEALEEKFHEGELKDGDSPSTLNDMFRPYSEEDMNVFMPPEEKPARGEG